MQLSENIKEIIKRIANYAFYVALTVELALYILDRSVYIIRYDGKWFRLTFVLFLIKLLLTEYKRKEWLIIGAFMMLGLVSYLVTGRNEILRIAVFVASCKDVNHDFVIKYTWVFTLAGCLILVILSFCGIGDMSLTRDFGRGEITTRYCFGMGHPNGLHCMFWSLCSLCIYVYRNCIKWVHLVIMMLGNIGLFMLTDSKMGFITLTYTLAVSCIMLNDKSDRLNKQASFLTWVCIGVVFVISLIMMTQKLFWERIVDFDYLITGRMTYTHMNVTQAKLFFWLPFSAAGRSLESDLGIVKMIYWYGYVPTIIFLLLCGILVIASLKEGDKITFAIVTSIILYSMFEGHAISLFIVKNHIFLFLGKYWTKMIGLGEENGNVQETQNRMVKTH